MIRNIALVQDPDGDCTVHRAECPAAREAAAAGRPVLTMLGVQRSIPRDQYRQHDCMNDMNDK